MRSSTACSTEAAPARQPERAAAPFCAAGPFALLVVLLAACNRGDIVGTIELGKPGVTGSTTISVEAGQRYVMVQDFDYDQDGLAKGPERRHCYVWQIDVSQPDVPTRKLRCPAFRRSRCTSSVRVGGRRAGTDCFMRDCEVAFEREGPATIRARLEETADCPPGPTFLHDLKASRLRLKVGMLSDAPRRGVRRRPLRARKLR